MEWDLLGPWTALGIFEEGCGSVSSFVLFRSVAGEVCCSPACLLVGLRKRGRRLPLSRLALGGSGRKKTMAGACNRHAESQFKIGLFASVERSGWNMLIYRECMDCDKN